VEFPTKGRNPFLPRKRRRRCFLQKGKRKRLGKGFRIYLMAERWKGKQSLQGKRLIPVEKGDGVWVSGDFWPVPFENGEEEIPGAITKKKEERKTPTFVRKGGGGK